MVFHGSCCFFKTSPFRYQFHQSSSPWAFRLLLHPRRLKMQQKTTDGPGLNLDLTGLDLGRSITNQSWGGLDLPPLPEFRRVYIHVWVWATPPRIPVVNMKVGIQGAWVNSYEDDLWREGLKKWKLPPNGTFFNVLTLNKPSVWWNLRWIRVGCNVGCQGYCSQLQGNCCFDETDSTYSVAGIEAWNPPNCRPPVSWRCWERDGTSWKVSEKQPINPWRCWGYVNNHGCKALMFIFPVLFNKVDTQK